MKIRIKKQRNSSLAEEEISSTDAPSLIRQIGSLRRTLARRSSLAFTQYTYPGYDTNFHHVIVGDALDRVLQGTTKRLMLFEPPQNGKTEQVSRRFPAYALGRNPDLKVLAASYNASLAHEISREVQKIIDSQSYHELFPATTLASASDAEKKTEAQFQVVGHKGSYYATGVEGALTGRTAHLGIIDDPFKSRAEAESDTIRASVWDWYKTAFRTRLFADTGAIIICLTRWHQDDLAGKLLDLARSNPSAEQWEVIEFPALIEDEDDMLRKHPQDPRQIGEALWPSKYPVAELLKRRVGAGSYDWASLYQQRPTPAGGAKFKDSWFDDRIVDTPPPNRRRVRGWDIAATEGGGDYTAGVLVSTDGEKYFVENVIRTQSSTADVNELIKLTARQDGHGTPIREEKEGGASGKAVIEARTLELKGFDYQGIIVSGSKAIRANPFSIQCEQRNVYLVKGDWNKAYLNELCKFPTGAHDDQVDATSTAFNALTLEEEAPEAGVW